MKSIRPENMVREKPIPVRRPRKNRAINRRGSLCTIIYERTYGGFIFRIDSDFATTGKVLMSFALYAASL